MLDSRWALCNESNKEVHVIDECVVVGPGQVFGLMFVSSCSIVVHIHETLLHAGNITQILWQVLGVKGVFSILWRSREDCECNIRIDLIYLSTRSVTLLIISPFSPHLAAPDPQV